LIVAKLDWLLTGGGLAAAAGAVWLVVAIRMRRPRDLEEIERQRREHVNRVGRIVEGKVLDVVVTDAETPAPPAASGVAAGATGPGKSLWVVFCYSISGVTYEAAQDISDLAPGASPTAGELASVKYDPANLSSSILAAQGWLGLT
jgi:hypothetical protein